VRRGGTSGTGETQKGNFTRSVGRKKNEKICTSGQKKSKENKEKKKKEQRKGNRKKRF